MANFSFGNLSQAKAPATAAPNLSLGGSTGGFKFGNLSTAGLGGQSKTGFALPTPATTTATGLTLGATPTQATSGTTGLSGGFKLGTPSTSTTGVGFSLGSTATTTASTGFSLGGVKLGTTTTTAGTTATGLTLGATTTTTASGFNFGGASTQPAANTGNIFSATASVATKGLGGVDPKLSTTGTGTVSGTGKTSDSKVVKEVSLPADISGAVEQFRKHMKSQKAEREEIARMSSRDMYKVQEEVDNLRQLLALVSNSLQRNAVAVTKLKAQSAQELKNAEVCQRTKDTPPGLQYENTAPAGYFHSLVEEFEVRMLMYRQQIEELESHLALLNQPAARSPQELSMLFSRLHKSFLALAAQLQVVHEAVKNLKEQYLNYRRVFHGDMTDMFEKRKAVDKSTITRQPPTTIGPSSFTGAVSASAMAMASVLNRTQQPAGASSFSTGQAAPGAAGLFGSVTSSGLTGGTSSSTGFSFGGGTGGGASLFGSTAKTSAATGTTFGFGASKPLGSGFGSSSGMAASGSLFGSSSTGGFSTPQQQTQPTGTATPVAGTAPEGQVFPLQKPPAGNKRGKRS